MATSRTSGGAKELQSGSNEARRVNDSSVSIVTKCVLAIGVLQGNRVGIMYPHDPLMPPPQQILKVLSTEWTPVTK